MGEQDVLIPWLWTKGNYFLNHSNLNSQVPSSGKLLALCCLDSLASHQCVSALQGLF